MEESVKDILYTSLDTRRVNFERKKLTKNWYFNYKGREFKVGHGFITDGKSVPKYLELIFGSQFEGLSMPAAVAHDYLHKKKKKVVSQSFAHAVFRDMYWQEVKENAKWVDVPWRSKLWQYPKILLSWFGIVVWNRVKYKDWE